MKRTLSKVVHWTMFVWAAPGLRATVLALAALAYHATMGYSVWYFVMLVAAVLALVLDLVRVLDLQQEQLARSLGVLRRLRSEERRRDD